MYTDPISDYLTRIRNAITANHDKVLIPNSKIKENISKVLLNKGYIKDYKLVESDKFNYLNKNQKLLEISLKYSMISTKREYSITSLKRVSKPGLRKYYKCSEIPRVLNGLGISVISTSNGVISDKEAKKLNIGGEILCNVY